MPEIKETSPEMQQAMQKQSLVDTGNEILKFEEEEKQLKRYEEIEKELYDSYYGERLIQDEALRANHDVAIGTGVDSQLGPAFLDPLNKYIKKLYKDYYKAIQKEDFEERDKAFSSLKLLKQEVDGIKEMKKDYADNMFGGDAGESKLSKGNSRQQISFSDQMYTQNSDLKVIFGEKKHIKDGILDYYDQPINVNMMYGIIKDFEGNDVFIKVMDGNKDLFVPPMMKALEYQQARKEQSDLASEAMATGASPSLNIGGIAYQMKKLFASKETVLSFAHDDILEDGSSFKSDLYMHEALEFITYEDFDLGKYDENKDGMIDEMDRVRLVDAITNQDNPFFDEDLLRALVTEYFTKKMYMAWGKQMNFPEGWLHSIDINRVKLNINRFRIAWEQAVNQKQPRFLFDGKPYSTVESKKFLEVAAQHENKLDPDYVEKVKENKMKEAEEGEGEQDEQTGLAGTPTS